MAPDRQGTSLCCRTLCELSQQQHCATLWGYQVTSISGSQGIQSIVHLDKRCFIHCLCYLELGVLQQLKLLQWLGMLHRSQIVHESSSSHDKIKEQCLLLCIVLNVGLSKLPSPNSFVVLHACALYWFTAADMKLGL